MAKYQFKFNKGSWEHVVISRIVPGKVVYVSNTANETAAFTPSKFSIRDPSGSLHHYRGQSFSELGLDVGRKVDINFENGDPVLVVDAGGRR